VAHSYQNQERPQSRRIGLSAPLECFVSVELVCNLASFVKRPGCTARAKPAQCAVREGCGTLRLRVWPTASAALCPKGASAPRFHRRMIPAQSVKMMASGAYAIKAVSSVVSCMQVNNPFPEHRRSGSISLGFFPRASFPPAARSGRLATYSTFAGQVVSEFSNAKRRYVSRPRSCLCSTDARERAYPSFAALYSTVQRRQTPLKSPRCLPPRESC